MIRRAILAALLLVGACTTPAATPVADASPDATDASAAVCSERAGAFAPLSTRCGHFVDEAGRTVVLTGVNARVDGVWTARPEPSSGLVSAARDAWVEATRHLRAMPRNPEVLIFATLQPVMFVLLFVYVFGGAIGAAFMCTFACALAVGAGAGACRLVDHSARTMFLRERASALPPMRLLPSPRR